MLVLLEFGIAVVGVIVLFWGILLTTRDKESRSSQAQISATVSRSKLSISARARGPVVAVVGIVLILVDLGAALTFGSVGFLSAKGDSPGATPTPSVVLSASPLVLPTVETSPSPTPLSTNTQPPMPTATHVPTVTPMPTVMPTPGPVTHTVIVPAAQPPPGIDTGLVVQQGAKFVINATGRAQYGINPCTANGQQPWTDPNGNRYLSQTSQTPDCAQYYAQNLVEPNYPVGALVARIGSGSWFFVGSYYSAQALASGEVYLLYNDAYDGYGDNSGEYTATVAVGG